MPAVRGKPSIVILFATVLLLPLLLSTALQAFQVHLKHRAEARIESETLITITIPVSDVEWMEEGREIRVRGEMFDIKSYTEAAGIFTATGVYDKEETEVMEWLSHFNDREQTTLIIQLLLLSQTFAAIVYGLLSVMRKQPSPQHLSCLFSKPSHPFHSSVFYPPKTSLS